VLSFLRPFRADDFVEIGSIMETVKVVNPFTAILVVEANP